MEKRGKEKAEKINHEKTREPEKSNWLGGTKKNKKI